MPQGCCPPQEFPTHDWTGFHIGAGAGVALTSSKNDTGAFISVPSQDPKYVADFKDVDDSSDQGALGTLEAGFDVQIHSFVVGALLSYDFAKQRVRNPASGLALNDFDIPTTETTVGVENEWEVGDSLFAGGRLGLLVEDDVLAYVLGGYAEVKVSVSSSYSYGALPRDEY